MPLWVTTRPTVRTRILRSSANDTRSTYSTSSANRRSQLEGVPAPDLREARDAWHDVVTAGLRGRVAFEIPHQQRPRTDEAHVALEHVDQLRDLVDAQATEHAAESRETLRVGEQPSPPIAAVVHGAELEQREGLPVQARPRLSKQHRSAHRGPDPNGCHGRDGQTDEKDGQRHGDVEPALASRSVQADAHAAGRCAWLHRAASTTRRCPLPKGAGGAGGCGVGAGTGRPRSASSWRYSA